jgi:hypothetical protein
MTTLHAIKIIVYSANKQQLQAFIEELHSYFDAIPHAYSMSIRALVFKTCFVMYLSYERTGCGKHVKDEAIADYTSMIQSRILPKYPSFFVEFYMHHWHLRDYKKESHAMGTEFLLDDSLYSVCAEVKNYVDISNYFYSLNRHEPIELKETDWRPGMPLDKYLVSHGKSENEWNPFFATNWQSCQIEDD